MDLLNTKRAVKIKRRHEPVLGSEGALPAVKGFEFKEFLARNAVDFSVWFLLILGAFIGILLINRGGSTTPFMKNLAENILIFRNTDSFFSIISSSVITSLTVIFFIFIFGFSSIGLPFTAFAVIIRGLGMGTVCGYFYYFYGFKGLVYISVAVLPALIVMGFGIAKASKYSILSSLNLFLFLIGKNKNQYDPSLTREYLIGFLAIFRYIFFAGLLDAVTAKLVNILSGGTFLT